MPYLGERGEDVPEEEQLEKFREIRGEIDQKILDWLEHPDDELPKLREEREQERRERLEAGHREAESRREEGDRSVVERTQQTMWTGRGVSLLSSESTASMPPKATTTEAAKHHTANAMHPSSSYLSVRRATTRTPVAMFSVEKLEGVEVFIQQSVRSPTLRSLATG